MIAVQTVGELPDVETVVSAELEAAAFRMAEAVKGLWIQVAQQLGVHNTGAYIRGIRAEGNTSVKVTEEGDGRWLVELVIVNTANHASYVEDGHAAFHLPDKIDWGGPRVKHGPSGPYLHIPFRHAAYVAEGDRADKGVTLQALRRMMPQEVYQEAKRLARVVPLRVGPIRQDGRFIAADRYAVDAGQKKRPSRLEGRPGVAFVASATGEIFEEQRGARGKNPGWGSSRFEGLFKSGPAGHTAYMTVRTITPRSPGWHIPAVEGKPVIATVERLVGETPEFGQLVEDIFTAKAAADGS